MPPAPSGRSTWYGPMRDREVMSGHGWVLRARRLDDTPLG
jgi:hypothetical protein